ncbi:MAG: segregation/condensation protein A [Candidatus Eremiobacteraeota bacterium]|nr:segregation/condensation protein A [Candidatus Eremiobacteraeota bacterium]
MYSVKLEIFEGPLDLLFYLVDKNQLDITEISLALICREYEDYLINLRKLNLEVESSFLTVLASLLEIKSKTLLPDPPQENEDENYQRPEHELVIQLREYQRIKSATKELEEIADKAMLSFPRPETGPVDDEPVVFTSQITTFDLMDMYICMMRRMKKQEETGVIEMQAEKVSFPLIFRRITKKIKARLSTSLFELFESPPNRIHFIATFLVLLEMARRGKISLVQDQGDEIITIINRRRARREKKLEMAV